MVHHFKAPATREIVEYLRNGGRTFHAYKESRDGELIVHFMATTEYVEKMKSRPYLTNIQITRKI